MDTQPDPQDPPTLDPPAVGTTTESGDRPGRVGDAEDAPAFHAPHVADVGTDAPGWLREAQTLAADYRLDRIGEDPGGAGRRAGPAVVPGRRGG